jgi:NitT/TauT family transport system substrate-binding protein
MPQVSSDNPKVFAAVLRALRQAMALINQDKVWAAKIYLEEENSRLDPQLVHSIVSGPDVNFTVAPLGFMKFADFMFKAGMIKEHPSN